MEENIGLKIGLEIHQQLDSGHKLFCNCPILKSEELPIQISRKFRPVAGELDAIDPAALHEYIKNRCFDYKISKESSCLIETDEEPPKRMNKKSLYTVLQVCKLLNCNIFDEIHIMRKTVIDGSSVPGFQRTCLIGYNGFLETSFGKIKIESVCVEEDSAPMADRGKNNIQYRLDRLGTPLVEISTDASIKTPSHAKEAALKIGHLLRSVDVIRGIGSIRQDVNISIRGGARVEIKGFQDIDMIEEMIESEIRRQMSLIQIKEELRSRELSYFESEIKDVTPLFAGTQCRFISESISSNGKVLAFKLPGFGGILRLQCGDRTFGRELSSYASVHGYGITHSDEDLNKYQLVWEFEELKKHLQAQENDVVAVITGMEPKKAAEYVINRANKCLAGVPEETRVSDGIGSKYARPLPGSDRMYPETDIMPIRISKSFFDSIIIPKTLEEKQKDLEQLIPKEMAEQIVKSDHFSDFEDIIQKTHADAVLVANTLLSTLKDMKRKGFDTDKIKKQDIISVFFMVKDNKLSKDSMKSIFELLCKPVKIDEAIRQFRLMNDEDILSVIKKKMLNIPDKKESLIIGLVMAEIRGRADGKKVLKLIREELNK